MQKIDLSNETIETERLLLRPFKQTDLHDFFEYAKVEGVGEMAGWPHHETIETTQMILNDFLNNKDVFAIVLKSDNKVIGSLGVHDAETTLEMWGLKDEYDTSKSIKEIGYVLSKNYWGNGFVPEASNAVIDWGFSKANIDVFVSGHFTQNNQSARVIAKMGFVYKTDTIYDAKLINKKFEAKNYYLTKEMWVHNKQLKLKKN